MPTYARYPVAIVRGEGVNVYDTDGRAYLDFAGALTAMPLGHSHPAWREAVHRQVDRLALVTNLFNTSPQAALAERLVDVMSVGDAQVFLSNSGAEANEAAIKLARRWGLPRGRTKIVALEGSFHGRTVATLAATGQPSKRAPFEPLVDWFVHVAPEDVRALDVAIGEDTAAVMMEPVLGEGGVFPLSDAYLRAARDISAERGALLLFDEVQSGIGRCGAWRASSLAGVTPDVLTLAKGLGGGLPIGATLARREIAFGPGEHGSTFGGGPIPCAAGLSVLSTIEEEGLLENSKAMGERLIAGLRASIGDVATVRGLGLLVGVELGGGILARDVVTELIADGLLATEAGANVLRLSPPLIVSADQTDAAVQKVADAIEEVVGAVA
jgi:predicted acetylornithine/succinylornithine family transaminase